MLSRAAKSSSIVPSRNALRVLRQLALAGSTVGGFCTVAALTYEAHRRVRIAEKIIDNKRTLHNTAPNYDATSAAKRLKVMVEAAEAGEFLGIESLKARNRNLPDADGPIEPVPSEPGSEFNDADNYPKPKPMISLEKRHRRSKHSLLGGPRKFAFSHNESIDKETKARNDTILAREKEQSEAARREGKLPLEEEIRNLIHQDREIHATTLFLAATISADCISLERSELGYHLFTANCAKGHIYSARTLFNRLSKVGIVSNGMWSTIMHLLAKEGHIEAVGAIFERFKYRFIVPTHLLEVILRCLVESKRLDEAKSLFFRRFKDDRNCGLCGAYLDGIWKKTKSMELVLSQLRLIIQRLEKLDRKPTEKLFNPVIKAMVETGRTEEAEALLHSMQTDYGVEPGCRSIGLILYSRALNCEWDKVMDGMRTMHEHGYTSNKKDFTVAFDRVFLEYYPTHSADQILDFLVSSINDFDIVPDTVLYRHMIEAIIEKGTEDMVTIITDMDKDRNWNIGFSQSKIKSLVKSRRLAMTDSPVGIWRMMQAAKGTQSRSASTRRIFGSSSETWAIRGQKIAPINVPAAQSFPETLSHMIAFQSPTLYVPLHKRLEHCINMGQHAEAMTIFDLAKRGGFVMRPIHVTLTIIAAILGCKETGLTTARRMITSEWDSWKNLPSLRYSNLFTPWTPLFFQRIMAVDPDAIGHGGLIKMAMFEYYNICANTTGMTVRHFSAASTSRHLIASGSPELAVELLTTIYQSRWRISHGFDQVLLKILLRGFAKVGNLRGMWWCILTVLSRSEATKLDFLVEATAQIGALERHLAPSASASIQKEVKYLRKALGLLDAKSKGEPSSSTLSVDLSLKQTQRNTWMKNRSIRNVKYPLEQQVLRFDEETELDVLMQRKQFGKRAITRWWAESNLSRRHSGSPEDPLYPETPLYPEYIEDDYRTWDQLCEDEKSADYHLEFEPGKVEECI